MNRTPDLLGALVLALAVAAGAALVFGAREAGRAEEFHRLVGGLGFGPALDLARCEFSFDPRLCPACPHDCGPVPGGKFFCPYHAGAILDYRPLGAPRDRREGDAHLP
jgi:hypothetical protein